MAARATTAVLAACLLATAAQGEAPAGRMPTSEELRTMTLQLEAAGFAPCSQVTLVDGRWSCRTRSATGQAYQLSLSNLDFAVLGRQRL